MATLLGERFVPESVQSRRRSMRRRLNDLREPVRSRREDLVPGPDLIGTAETRIDDLRRSFVTRDSAVASFREMLNMGDDEEVENGEEMENGENGSEPTRGRSGDEVRA